MSTLAVLLLFVTASTRSHPQRASIQTAGARAALMNPKHNFWSQTAPDVSKVKIETSKASFVIGAHREWAPRGVDRFYNLARAGYFDDSRFFRVRAGFIAQFGIPGDPAIAAIWKSQTIPDDPVWQRNTRGFVAYAMTGPDSRTSQLYYQPG